MKIRIAGAALAALAFGGVPASADYTKVADPTGKLAGNGGGIVIGTQNGERTLELGLCGKTSGLGGQYGHYYWMYASTTSPPGSLGYNPEDDACSGEAPVARTSTPSELAAETAAFAGQVNPNGLATKYWFEYGTDTTYGTKTPEKDAGSKWSRVGATSAVDGLEPETTYHVRLVARNSTGTTNGPDVEFTTCQADGCVAPEPEETS